MKTHYYVSLYPTEALIASQLEPDRFGTYMAIGQKYGSFEKLMFAELDGEFGRDFDWNYARERCVSHQDGRPKNSVWMSVYRVLEHIPLASFASLYLTTTDGRTLELRKGAYSAPHDRGYYVYQELAPISPLVVSALDPQKFAAFITDRKAHIQVPKIVFADLKVIDLEDPTKTGNIGGTYDKNIEHLKACIASVVGNSAKPTKNVERANVAFGYQIINHGIYIADANGIAAYPMPTADEIRQHHYDWGRSAMLL